MPSLNIRPRTLTDPEVIPEAGASVTFTVETRASAESSDARFTFRLRVADGYRWADGGTATSRTATLGREWETHDFPLRIEQRTQTDAALLVVEVEAALLSNPSDTRESVAKLTVDLPLKELIAAHRATNGLTQANLARDVGVSASWISSLEHGAHPSFEVFANIKRVVE